MLISVFISFLTITLILISVWVKRRFSYWHRMGVPYIQPTFPFGNRELTFPTKILDLHLQDYYTKLKGKGPIGGLFTPFGVTGLALDLNFIKQILIKDFNHFQERGIYYNETDDPLSAHLFALSEDKWRSVRNKLSPTFTSGKMKFMFSTVVDVANKFRDCLNGMIDDRSMDLEVYDIMARFTTDVIGSCAFGIECNSLTDPHTEFRRKGKEIFEDQRHSRIAQILIGGFPNLARKFGVKLNTNDVSEFFQSIVQQTVTMREEKNIKRNDFMDIVIDLKNRKDNPLSMNEIAAQSFLFFVAGFESSSTTLQFILYELVNNREIQTKAREEVRQIIEKFNGEFTYEAMMSMEYLDQIIHETLRKHPPFGTLIRQVTKPYQIPGTNILLPKGLQILISNYAIQHDPDIYPEPEKFIPERFAPDVIATKESVSFLTFGEGPRNCIGLRFGLMQLRVAMVMLLKNFEFFKCDKTPTEIIHEKDKFIYNNSSVMSLKGGLWIKLKKL